MTRRGPHAGPTRRHALSLYRGYAIDAQALPTADGRWIAHAVVLPGQAVPADPIPVPDLGARRFQTPAPAVQHAVALARAWIDRQRGPGDPA